MNEFENYTEAELARILIDTWKDTNALENRISASESLLTECYRLRRFYSSKASIDENCINGLLN